MEIIHELHRDHQMLRGKLELLHSAMALAPETWFVLREGGFVLWRRLHTHSERETEARRSSRTRAAVGVTTHTGSLQSLAALNRLVMAERPDQSLDTVQSTVRAVIHHLKQECLQQEARLFPLLEPLTDASAEDPAARAARSLQLDEGTSVNRVLKEHPQAQPVFARHGINPDYEGYDCVAEVAWRHGIAGGAFLEELAGAITAAESSVAIASPAVRAGQPRYRAWGED